MVRLTAGVPTVQPTPADIERLTFFHPMNRVHFPYGFASGPL